MPAYYVQNHFLRMNLLKDIWEPIKNHLREESLENQLSGASD